MWNKIVNFLLARSFRLDRIGGQLADRLGAEATEEVFKLLLHGMELAFCVDAEFRRNLDGFAAGYLFASADGPINVAVTYGKRRMCVREGTLAKPNVRVDFRDYRAVLDFLTQPDPDVLDMMLNQKLTITGNLNYLYKFGYMARHLLHDLGIAR